MARHSLRDNSPLPLLCEFETIQPTPTMTGYELMVLVLGGRLIAFSECGTLTVTEGNAK